MLIKVNNSFPQDSVVNSRVWLKHHHHVKRTFTVTDVKIIIPLPFQVFQGHRIQFLSGTGDQKAKRKLGQIFLLHYRDIITNA